MYVSTVDQLAAAIEGMAMSEDEVVAIFVGEKGKPDLGQLVLELSQKGIKFFGGLFPGVIHGDQRYEEGAVVVVLPMLAGPFLVRGLDGTQIEIPGVDLDASMAKCTAVTLVDGLTSNVALFLAEMFNRFGSAVNYFGGGAGSLSLEQEPCVFTPEGVFQDAAVVAFVKLQSGLGVRHGWQELVGPIVATHTNKNVIVELNWRNAFEVYKEAVEADSGKELTREGFFDIAKGYPFGILKENAEHIVRDPIAANERGELICVGEVPENTALSILRGENAALIGAAGQAAAAGLAKVKGSPQSALVIDCISRVLFLGDDFEKELAAVEAQLAGSGGVPEGALTLGEISSSGEGLLEFYNKTMVVGVLYE
jgi:hypothetical protein